MPAKTKIEEKVITTVVGTYGSARIRITVMNKLFVWQRKIVRFEKSIC